MDRGTDSIFPGIIASLLIAQLRLLMNCKSFAASGLQAQVGYRPSDIGQKEHLMTSPSTRPEMDIPPARQGWQFPRGKLYEQTEQRVQARHCRLCAG